MRSSRLGARPREGAVQRLSGGQAPDPAASPPMVTFKASGLEIYSAVELSDCVRLSLMLTCRGRGSFREQALELLRSMRRILDEEKSPVVVITQTVFLRNPSDRPVCE